MSLIVSTRTSSILASLLSKFLMDTRLTSTTSKLPISVVSISILSRMAFSASSMVIVKDICGRAECGMKGAKSGSKGGTGWSVPSPSVNTSPCMELTSEQDPDKEQDLDIEDIGMGGTRFRHFLGGIGGGTGDDEGVDVVANLVGVLVITDSLAWICLVVEDVSLSSTKTILSNLLDRLLFRTVSSASLHA